MRIFSITIFFFLFGGICVAAAPSHLPFHAPSPTFGQSIWEIIMQKIHILMDFPAANKYAKYGYWAGIVTALSGLVSVASLFSLFAGNVNSALGIFSLLFFAFSYLLYTVSLPVAIVFGIISLRQIKKRPDQYGGKKYAIQGIVLALIWIIFSFIYLISRI